MGKRIISGLIAGAIVIFVLVFLPSYVCNIVATILALIGTHEFIKAINSYGYKPIRGISYASCLILLFIGQFELREIYKWAFAFLGVMVIASLIYAFFIRKGLTTLIDISFTFFVVLYVDILLSFFLLTYYINNDGIQIGRYLVWYILFGACLTDAFAYFVGVKLGKHKLCPEISPKKTVEGAIGGIIGCIISLLIYTYVLNKLCNFGINYISIGLISVFVAPITTTNNLAHNGLFAKALGSSDSPISPANATYPPRGILLIEYIVSFLCLDHILGPKPIANSSTFIPTALAVRKCPPS